MYLVKPFSFHIFMASGDARLPGFINLQVLRTGEAFPSWMPSKLFEEQGSTSIWSNVPFPKERSVSLMFADFTKESLEISSWRDCTSNIASSEEIHEVNKECTSASGWISKDEVFSCDTKFTMFFSWPKQRSATGVCKILFMPFHKYQTKLSQTPVNNINSQSSAQDKCTKLKQLNGLEFNVSKLAFKNN